jgi:hypothetical protein
VVAFDRDRTPRSAFVVGLACGLAVLARIDLAPALVVLPVGLAWRVRGRWPVGPWALGGGLLVVPVAVVSYLRFGHLLTVSGAIKLDSMAQQADERWGGRLTFGYLRYVSGWAWAYAGSLVTAVGGILLLGALVGGLLWWRQEADRRPIRFGRVAFALGLVGATVVLKGVMDVVLLPQWSGAWYSSSQRVLVGFAVGIGVWHLLRRSTDRLAPAVAVFGAALVVVLAWPAAAWDAGAASHRRGTDWRSAVDAAADWAIEEGPAGTYGAYDAGLLGYRLDGSAPLVNLDGLVNDVEHAELVMDGASLATLLRHDRVDVLINRLDAVELEELRCASRLWTSEAPVRYDGTDEHVYALDVRGCR